MEFKKLSKKEVEERDKLLEPYWDDRFSIEREDKWLGGTRRFQSLPLKVMETIIERGWMDMDEWNSTPAMNDSFLPFMRKYPDFTAHGYAVSSDRDDCRVTVEGIELKGRKLTQDEMVDFVNYFREADDFVIEDGAYCWYD